MKGDERSARRGRRPTGGKRLAVWLLALLMGCCGPAQAAMLFRISTENTPTHFQSRIVQRFAQQLAARTAGRLDVRFYPGARLFRDSDVIAAMAQGRVEMAVPGTWQLDRFEPSVALLMLPSMYGRDAATCHRIADGPIGRTIAARLQTAVNAVVVGRWIDLGPVDLFFAHRTVTDPGELRGLTIRIAGGVANSERLRAFGAVPQVIAWPDFPAALERRQVDGVLTTFETAASAQLWNQGLDRGFEDREYFGQYIPLVSLDAWNRMPEDVRAAIRTSWAEVVEPARAEAARQQEAARAAMIAHGMRVDVPGDAAVRAWRERLLADEPALAARLGVPRALVEQLHGELAEGRP